jgi:glycosyltransferase involved in cell wall biosynthesis
MLSPRPQISLVIPAYNEERRIERTLKDVTASLDYRTDKEYEVLVVMDGCTDKTSLLVEEILSKKNSNAISLIFPNRLGKGGAIIEALKHTKGQYIAFIDADGSIPISELIRLIDLAQKYDLVVGSRYKKTSKVYLGRPLKRALFSRTFNVLTKLLFWKIRGISDTQCGVKVFNRRLVDKISKDLLITDFVFDVNLIYAALKEGFTVREVGIEWAEQEGGKLSVGFLKSSIVMTLSLLRLRFHYLVPQKNFNSRYAAKLYSFFNSWFKA